VLGTQTSEFGGEACGGIGHAGHPLSAIGVDVFIMFVGARFLLQPERAAAGYGVPSPATAYTP
jgi:hypothetical protein